MALGWAAAATMFCLPGSSVAAIREIESGQAAPAGDRQARPRMTLAPGLVSVLDHRATERVIPPPFTPPGFQPLFNGVDLGGWHVSRDSNHGATPLIMVRDGMIIASQDPPGRGGLLISDDMFGDFELYLEVRSDWGNDSGLLFRVTEAGAGYQVTLDTLPCGGIGRLEGVGGVRMASQSATVGSAPPCHPDDPGQRAWKRDDWNIVRIRVVGDAPTVDVSINDVRLPTAMDDQNRAVGRIRRGPIALQIHGGTDRWQAGGFWRWRSIAVRRLP